MSAWRIAAYRAVRPLLFRADPEAIHHRALASLRVAGRTPAGRALCRFASGIATPEATRQPVELLGLHFRNRIGLAAGFDKDGLAIAGWEALGLGFVELGTVTPRPQAGNPRPRLFRLVEDEALVNRMGFNNDGADALARRIADARPRFPPGFVVGVNIGRNRDTPDASAVDDFVAAATSVGQAADYIAINVSSPNTPGLRNLQDPSRLIELLDRVRAAAPAPPILVKLSPDLEGAKLAELLAVIGATPASGVILSNTTTRRSGDLRSQNASEEGGLSGRPLRDRTLAAIGRATGSTMAIVASGGITSGADARAAIAAGADLVQLWTGMIYAGPGLIGETVRS
ncbi:MAG: quinone-dependent dihydroorotate dehydrogenase [Chloroflexota bacterium]|nr:quinone-dependent dihydroorotate dehydrogenase [Chloroflexota bacterium]